MTYGGDFINHNKWEKLEDDRKRIAKIAPGSMDLMIEKSIICFCPSDMKRIQGLSEDAKIFAVENDEETLEYIDNPSTAIQIAAVKENEFAISYIEDPSLEVQLAAVTANGTAIEYIEDPSTEVQMAAVKQNACMICYVKNQTEEFINVALEGVDKKYDKDYVNGILSGINYKKLSKKLQEKVLDAFMALDDEQNNLLHWGEDNIWR